MEDKLVDTLDGLIEQIGQVLTPVDKAGNTPMKPGGGLLPGSESQEDMEGKWSFQFSYEDPTQLLTHVELTVRMPVPVHLSFTSKMDKLQVNKLLEWLSRAMTGMEEL